MSSFEEFAEYVKKQFGCGISLETRPYKSTPDTFASLFREMIHEESDDYAI